MYGDQDDLDKWLQSQQAPNLDPTPSAAGAQEQPGAWARAAQMLGGQSRNSAPDPVPKQGALDSWGTILGMLASKDPGSVLAQDAQNRRAAIAQWEHRQGKAGSGDLVALERQLQAGNLDARNRELGLQEKALDYRMGRGGGGGGNATPWAEANRIVTGGAPPAPDDSQEAQAVASEKAAAGSFQAPPRYDPNDQPSPEDVQPVGDFVAPEAPAKPGRQSRGAGAPAAGGGDVVGIPGTEIADPDAARIALGNPTTRRQLEGVVGGFTNADKALQRMMEIRKSKGIEIMSSPERAEYDMLQKQVASAYSELGHTGVLSKEEFERYAKEMPGLGFGDDKIGNTERVLAGRVGKEYDPTLDKLSGTRTATMSAIENALGARGLKYGNGAPKSPAAAEPPPPAADSFEPKSVKVGKQVPYATPGELGPPVAVDANDWKKRYERFKIGGAQ